MGSIIFGVSFNEYYEDNQSYVINTKTLKWLVIVLLPIFAYSINSLYKSMMENAMYEVLRDDSNESIGGYFARIIQFFSIIYLILFYRPENDLVKKEIKWYVITLCVMGFLTAIMNATRNGMLFYFLPLVSAYLMSNNISLRKQLRYLVIAVLAFLGYYFYISVNKFAWRYNNSDIVMVFSSEIGCYLSGSIVAFDNAIESHADTRLGANTFRFFMALSDRIWGESSAIHIVNDFETAYGVTTNVFSFYDYYLRDFGLAFAVFMQFVVSCIHGFVYKIRTSVFGLFLLSMLTYPLVMQFFQDQYFSLFSTWLQIILFVVFIMNTNIFISKRYA